MTELVLVDTNIILDWLGQDPIFGIAARAVLSKYQHALAINPIIYAELAVAYESSLELDKKLSIFKKLPLNYEVAFLASKPFLRYRKNGGIKTSVLPDFFIGAHAVHLNIPLMTRDQRRYLTYFPEIKLCQ